MSCDDLPSTTPLLRLVSPKPEFQGEDGGVTWLALRPSSGDIREAEARGTPIRVSVWRFDSVGVEAIEASTGRVDRLRKKLLVSDIDEARERYSIDELRAISDPLSTISKEIERAVSEAHCAIEGLELNSTRGEKKPQWKARLAWLAQRMKDVE